MSFLVDTNICSAYLKQDRIVFNRFLQYAGGLHVSLMTLAELYVWAKRRRAAPWRMQGVQRLRSDFILLELDDAVIEKYGEVGAQLHDQGRSMDAADLLIAATALVHDLTLVTHNTRDFLAVPGLRMTDWLLP